MSDTAKGALLCLTPIVVIAGIAAFMLGMGDFMQTDVWVNYLAIPVLAIMIIGACILTFKGDEWSKGKW